MTGYILAAGSGRRIAPYGECRPKCLIPVLNRPVLDYALDALAEADVTKAVVAAGAHAGDVRGATLRRVATGAAAHGNARLEIDVVEVGETHGTAATLLACTTSDDPALVLYGDVLVEGADIVRLLAKADEQPGAITLLLSPVSEQESGDHIVVRTDGHRVTSILGHPRGTAGGRLVAAVLPSGFRRFLEACPSLFPNVQVGMMPPHELHLEAAVEVFRTTVAAGRGAGAAGRGNDIVAVFTSTPAVDIDKPWHILEANAQALRRACASLSEHELADGASIDESASVDGYVRLGRNSRIGRNVIVRGSLVAGDDVVIDAGAIINGNAAVGDRSFVGNACFVEDGSVIGRDCVVSHAAELDGVIFDGVYLYHYMEIYGVVGERTDIGAATVCGSLRFDDGPTTHRVLGRREIPRSHANATFIGDYCRTGVNATIMPGRKIGPYSIVGPGVVLEEDLPPRAGVRVKQEQERYPWGPERYGW